MLQNHLLFADYRQLIDLYIKEYPSIVQNAMESKDNEQFKQFLIGFVAGSAYSSSQVAQTLSLLIANDGCCYFEQSTGEYIQVDTIDYLRRVLRKEVDDDAADFLLDMYHLLRLLEQPASTSVSTRDVNRWMKRWHAGTETRVTKMREVNEMRIVKTLIDLIEHRHSEKTVYHFPLEATYEEKYRLVMQWWNEARFHLAMAARSPRGIDRYLGYTLSKETMRTLLSARRKGIPFFATPYYLSLLDTTGMLYDDETLRTYILYSPSLVEAFGTIKAWEREDVVEADTPNAAGWLVPNDTNIHRRYPDVAILIPDTMGRACGGLCSVCQRMFHFQSKRFNFDFEALKPHQHWNEKLKQLMHYFEEDMQLRDILITGGDAFMSRNGSLRLILDAVYQMALRKRRANEKLPEGEKYATLQRVRLGTRLPVYLPMRINDELVDILYTFKEKATAIGVSQFVIQTHFETPLEITPESRLAIERLLAAGWMVTNQLVFTASASRRGHTAKLRQELNRMGVICYYTFAVKGFQENYSAYTPNSRLAQEAEEEQYMGRLNAEQQNELCNLFCSEKSRVKEGINNFLKKHNLPFAATERHVMNLPGIGKSMNFDVIGITHDGKRIQRFSHDTSRRHSPAISHSDAVYITENKSVSAYLRQLSTLKENLRDYTSLWGYTRGSTAPRFPLYEYPEFDYKVTEHYNHIQLTL